jgi:signal transduction histidine kinase
MVKHFDESSHMGRLINAYPWSESPLGAIETWPSSLRTAVAIMLEARIPMYVAWGPQFIQFYNDAYLPILGSKNEDTIGQSTWQTWDEIWPVIGPMFETVLYNGQSHGFAGFQLFLERSTSQFLEEAFFDFSYSPIRNDDGTIGGVFLSCLETTSRVLHERRMEMLANALPIHYDKQFAGRYLMESHKQLSLSPKDLPFSLFIEHNLLDGHLSCLSSFGVQNELGTKSFLSPEGVQLIKNINGEGLFNLSSVLKSGLNFDLNPWPEQPSQCYIIANSYNQYNKRNILVMGLGSRAVFNDAYQQFFKLAGKYLQNQYEHFQMRKLDEEKLEAIKELSVKKDEFISVASHELKTPLTSAKAYLQIAAKTAHQDGNEKFVTGALKQLQRLQKLTSDLLDVSKINAGRLDYKMAEFDFKDLLEEAVANYQSTVTTHHIQIAEQVSVTVNGDYARLEQVINNLLGNGVKYSPKANQIIVRSSLVNGQLVVSIRDFGVGIPHDKMHRLFDRFYRIEETAMHFQGMGLGLFIVSEILGRHKGRFWVESEPGKGSTFYFMLPVQGHFTPAVERRDEEGYYASEHVTIVTDYENQWLDVDWKGFQNPQSIKQEGYKYLEIFKKSGFNKVLNDNTHVMGTWSDAAEWVGEEWFPMMEAAGLKYFAWIYSQSTFSQLSADKSIDVLKAGVTTRLFNNKTEAINWLKSV